VDNFTNVTVIKKANVYFNGNVTSRTVMFEDGTKKTLGIIMPGEYEFGTADKERMEILAGTLKALLPGSKEWKTYGPGQAFEIPANSKFKCAATEAADYCCSYIKG
jgi:purine/pyrimidine-nucleoside phosphorylase